MKNIFYFNNIQQIGGVETMFYHLAKKYQNNDITIYYKTADFKQLERLAQYVRVKQYKGEKLECEKAFFNYSLDIIDNIQAKEYIQIIHCDFDKCNVVPILNPKITKYIGVSQHVCDSFKQLTGMECELCYNPLVIDKPRKVLNLVSATRLSWEKGKKRMHRLADLLDEANIPYIWTVFTNDKVGIFNPNIIYMKPRLDVIDYIANADYLVQLSDTEGYSYSIMEALSVGTPVIVTPLAMLEEAGINETNSIVCDFEMKNVPLEKIYAGLPPFTYKANADGWSKLLAKGKSDYKKDLNTRVFIKPNQDYFDLVLNKLIKANDDPFEVSKIRAEHLVGLGFVSIVEDEIIKE